MVNRPITASGWREYEIVGEIPDDADILSYGLVFSGEGRVWIDEVVLEEQPSSGGLS